ncbi:MAG: hypothetical protein WC471_00355 [Candidatus Woesearchaeota archaeon]
MASENMDNEIVQRQIAFKVNLKDIVTKQLVKQEGWLPNYVEYGGQKISRVNVMGTVISTVSENENHIVIDDGEVSIIIRKFETQNIELGDYKVGSLLNIIGKIREFNNEKYIMPEAIIPVISMNQVDMRKKEIKLLHMNGFYSVVKEVVPKAVSTSPGIIEENVHEGDSEAARLIAKIRELDDGNGADIDTIISSLGPSYERTMQILQEQGDIFTTKPGKIKILE